jgi:hypothetical protein
VQFGLGAAIPTLQCSVTPRGWIEDEDDDEDEDEDEDEGEHE